MSNPPPPSDPLPPQPPGHSAPDPAGPPRPASPAPASPSGPPAPGSPSGPPTPASPTGPPAPIFQPGYAQPVYPRPEQQDYPATAQFPSYGTGPEPYPPGPYQAGPYQPGPYPPGPPQLAHHPGAPGGQLAPRRSNVPLIAVVVAVALLLCGGVAVAGVLVVRTVADRTRQAVKDLPALPTELPTVPTELPAVPTELPDVPGLPTDEPFGPGKAAKTVTVVYKVTGDGTVDIVYTAKTGEAPKRVRNARLPWRQEVSMTGASYVSVIAFRNDTTTGSVGCTALVDGEEVATRDAEGTFAIVNCSKLIPG